jgi:hypothetical protein
MHQRCITPGGGPADASLLAQQCPVERCTPPPRCCSQSRHLSHTAARSKRSQPSASQCPLSCPIRWLVQQSAPHHPLCAGCRSHISELFRSQHIPPVPLPAHPSFSRPTPTPVELTSVAMGLKTRPRLVAELFGHAEEKLFTPFAHHLASAKTSPGTRTGSACSGARSLLRLRVRASGPPGPWLRLDVRV